ncbi:hypothetical protein I4U23_007629 [Adineta vaga]|nr:hypothetical protein I4U23_007629 [Adineta vaga]
MSSMTYSNGGIPPTDDASTSSGAIVPNSYLTSNSNATYVTAASSGQYQHYYGHSIPPTQQQQQLLHLRPSSSSSSYSVATLNQLQHQVDFSNSSSSVASSSSSLESSHKIGNRKRSSDRIASATKTSMKRKASNNNDEDDDDEENKYYLRGGSSSNMMISTHNHNLNSDGIGDEDKEKQARENHCEIERRRRVKMASYFVELCDMVPACSNLARKPDKLTILRMAAQFMKNIRASNHSSALNSISISSQQDLHKPSFLNDQELKYLMIESCDAFLFALNCENLRVMYVSDAIQNILSYTCQDWYSNYFYDFIHPDDVEKVREQLNLQPVDKSPNGCTVSGRVLDLKSGTVKKDGHTSGTKSISSKRSFICRVRVGSTNPLDHARQNSFINPSTLRRRHRMSLGPSIDGHLYEVVHISGYIRNLTTHLHENTNHHPSSSSNVNGQMAFVAIARLQNSCLPNVNDLTNTPITTLNSITTEFTCRCHRDSGEILFVDQRCTPIIGYKTYELLNKIIYEQIHPDDQMNFQDFYQRTVAQKDLINTSSNLPNITIRFRTNIDNEYVSLKTSMYPFCNPCTDEIEFLIFTFLSTQSTIINKTSVIATANDYNRSSYKTYSRSNTNQTTIEQNSIIHYSSQLSSTYKNSEGQEYSTENNTNDERTYANNKEGSTWASVNDNWTATSNVNNSHVSSHSLYDQYH